MPTGTGARKNADRQSACGRRTMGHDVFISYSSKDGPAAESVRAMLEQQGVRCWIAPRDVGPGMEWMPAILDAIKECRIVVFVFSAHANTSKDISREMRKALDYGKVIIPFRLEDQPYSKTLEYILALIHNCDAFPPPIEAHLHELARIVKAILAQSYGEGTHASVGVSSAPAVLQAAGTNFPAPSTVQLVLKGCDAALKRWKRQKLLDRAIAATVIAVVAGILWFTNPSRQAHVDRVFGASLKRFVPGSPEEMKRYETELKKWEDNKKKYEEDERQAGRVRPPNDAETILGAVGPQLMFPFAIPPPQNPGILVVRYPVYRSYLIFSTLHNDFQEGGGLVSVGVLGKVFDVR
jgi:hypothetical protein